MSDFVSVLMEMRDGEVALDVNRKFQELLNSVFETGEKGKLTLMIAVKPSKVAMGGAVIEVETNHDCKLQKPELSVGRSLFFVTKEGTLSRDNPAQIAMYQAEETYKQHG